jgi:tRNA pseudouridine13 synthase
MLMSFDLMEPPPLLTADLPGIGGRIKEIPEDFEVEEIPAYMPCGAGEFLYLWLEKRAMGAEYFTRQVARRLDVAVGDVGTAGLKDRQAVTRQMVSVPARAADRLHQLEGEGIRLLRVSRHGNKLRPGHLRGNRFRVLIRGVETAGGDRLTPILLRLRDEGLANFYGVQRFGRQGETVRLGLALLGGEEPPSSPQGRRPNLRNPFLRKLALSAVQSALFNQYLSRRVKDGLFRRVLPGDVMGKWPAGGMFVVTDLAQEQARFDAREIVHAGPIFGRKTFAAADEAAQRESAVLSALGLPASAFAKFGKLLPGTRRYNVVYVDDLAVAWKPEGVCVTFTLPAGSYATLLLRELIKQDLAAEGDET